MEQKKRIHKGTQVVDISSPDVHDDFLATRADIAALLRIDPRHFDKLVKKGSVPKPCTPKGMYPRWRVGDIRAWLAANAEGKEAA
jgi:predicted DNA-binding transcriptional regulator AlpA